ncbi:MAG: hypothetical protein E7573_06675 [Ruminococcaceae bacterium]|nr:hypothetical protein [Oscillospiraceae bacterium]MBR3597441.1 hypothetical protein [Clostridia bacterium]
MKKYIKKLIAPVIVAVLLIIYFIVYFGFLITLLNGFFKYILGIVPLVFVVLTVYVCIERIKEIRSGEEDDLSKY